MHLTPVKGSKNYFKHEIVESFLNKNGFPIPVLVSDKQGGENFKVPGYPTKVIISTEGKFSKVKHGFDWKSLVSELAVL